MNARTSFTASEAAKLSKLPLTMIDYLCRSEVLVPGACAKRDRGCARLYSFGDVVMLKAMGQLLKHGISVSKLKKSLIKLRKHHPDITPGKLPASLLVTDGQRIFFRENKEVVLELSKGQLSFAFILELGSLQAEVRNQIAVSAVKRRKVA